MAIPFLSDAKKVIDSGVDFVSDGIKAGVDYTIGVGDRAIDKAVDLVRDPAGFIKDGLLDPTRPIRDIFLPELPIKFPFPVPTNPGNTTTASGNGTIDGLVNEVLELNGTIDDLLAQYEQAVANGEDTFALQIKIQQAMQSRLETVTFLSNFLEQEHETVQAVNRNLA